jgi:hypothetical protein
MHRAFSPPEIRWFDQPTPLGWAGMRRAFSPWRRIAYLKALGISVVDPVLQIVRT